MGSKPQEYMFGATLRHPAEREASAKHAIKPHDFIVACMQGKVSYPAASPEL